MINRAPSLASSDSDSRGLSPTPTASNCRSALRSPPTAVRYVSRRRTSFIVLSGLEGTYAVALTAPGRFTAVLRRHPRAPPLSLSMHSGRAGLRRSAAPRPKRQRASTQSNKDLPRHRARAAPGFAPTADDPLRMDPDQRRRQRDRLAAPADLDPARTPRVCACEIVDHDRGSPGPGHVSKLLRPLELVASDVDRVARRVVDPPDWDPVRRAVP